MLSLPSIALLLFAGAAPLLAQPSGAALFPCQGYLPRSAATGNNGVTADPIGAPDSHWAMLGYPGSGPAPAYSIQPHLSWVTASSANWISPLGGVTGGNATSSPPGTYRYVLTVTAPASATGMNVNIRYAADNAVEFFVNGASIGGYSVMDQTAFNQLHALSWSGPAAPGLNTLEARVFNRETFTGLLVVGELSFCIGNEMYFPIPDAEGCVMPLAAIDISTGTSSGAPDAPGSADDAWSVVSRPGGGSGSAYSIQPHRAWVKSTGANWINAFPGGANLRGAAAGSYEYQTEFYPSAGWPTAGLNIRFAADNAVQLYLNGVPIGGHSPSVGSASTFRQWHTILYLGPALQSGHNILEVRVENWELYTGLIVEGAVDPCLVGPGGTIGPLPVMFPIDPNGDLRPPTDGADVIGQPSPRDVEPSCDVGEDLVRCPPLARGGASCTASALLVRETDPLSVNAEYVISHATTASDPGEASEQDHQDVQHIALSIAGFDIFADVLYAECESHADGEREAHGRAGVLDLHVEQSGATVVAAKALEFEASATSDAATTGAMDCTHAHLVAAGQAIRDCEGPNTSLSGPGFVLVLDEQWGPVQNAADQWTYGGSALHLYVIGPMGVVTAEVVIGAVAVAVAGPAP